jgi:hypothetical protein
MAFEVEGVEYTPDAIENVRQYVVIPLRNEALTGDKFEFAAGLTHVLAYLSHLKELIKERSDNGYAER